jgi:hypothetical protein
MGDYNYSLLLMMVMIYNAPSNVKVGTLVVITHCNLVQPSQIFVCVSIKFEKTKNSITINSIPSKIMATHLHLLKTISNSHSSFNIVKAIIVNCT